MYVILASTTVVLCLRCARCLVCATCLLAVWMGAIPAALHTTARLHCTPGVPPCTRDCSRPAVWFAPQSYYVDILTQPPVTSAKKKNEFQKIVVVRSVLTRSHICLFFLFPDTAAAASSSQQPAPASSTIKSWLDREVSKL